MLIKLEKAYCPWHLLHEIYAVIAFRFYYKYIYVNNTNY